MSGDNNKSKHKKCLIDQLLKFYVNQNQSVFQYDSQVIILNRNNILIRISKAEVLNSQL